MLLACSDDLALSTGGGEPAFDGRAGQILITDELGQQDYRPNHPHWFGGDYFEYENGGSGRLGQGQGAFKNLPAGAGAQRTLLSGEPAWFNNAGRIETGTATTGSYAISLSNSAAIAFGATSGIWDCDVTLSPEQVSDATNTSTIAVGFTAGSSNAFLVTNGIYVRYRHNNNGGYWEAVSRKASVESVANTGVQFVPNNYLHIRVVGINDTIAMFWVRTTYDGVSPWTDPDVWESPHATITTNIPSGTGQAVNAAIAILKSAGTTSHKVKVGRIRVQRTAPGNEGKARGYDEEGVLSWIVPQAYARRVNFLAYGRGGWNPSLSAEFGASVGVSGVVDGLAVDNGGIGTSRLRTGVNTAGRAAYVTSKTLRIDASIDVMPFDVNFAIPVLSTVAQQAVFRAGYYDDADAPTAGVYFEYDASVSGQVQCVIKSSGGETRVPTGVTPTASQNIYGVFVLTPTSVSFWMKPNGAAILGSPVATITTNIPTSVDMMAGLSHRKLAGTTNNDAYYTHVLAYSATPGTIPNAEMLIVAPDDNFTASPSAPGLMLNVPSPRTQGYVIMSSAHANIWGSSDFGTGAGGDSSEFDEEHPNPETIFTGTTSTGHVAFGPGAGINGIVFSATSPRRPFTETFEIPIASDVTNQKFERMGFASHAYNAVANGVYVEVDDVVTPGLRFITIAGSGTPTVTVLPLDAGFIYEVHIEVDAHTVARVYLRKYGEAWPASPSAVHTTGIPSGTAQAVQAVSTIKKVAGTSNRKLVMHNIVVGIDRYGAN